MEQQLKKYINVHIILQLLPPFFFFFFFSSRNYNHTKQALTSRFCQDEADSLDLKLNYGT